MRETEGMLMSCRPLLGSFGPYAMNLLRLEGTLFSRPERKLKVPMRRVAGGDAARAQPLWLEKSLKISHSDQILTRCHLDF